MISVALADIAIVVSLVVTIIAYVIVSRIDRTYINVLVPSLIVGIPAYYFLPFFYSRLFDIEASPYAYLYVYAAIAAESLAFAVGYTRRRNRVAKLRGLSAYGNFGTLSVVFLGLGFLTYLPLLMEFRTDILNLLEIYRQTRTGFGSQFFLSATFLYIAIILILFTKEARWKKASLILFA